MHLRQITLYPGPDELIGYCQASNKKGYVMLFGDGSAEFVSNEQAEIYLNRLSSPTE